MEDIAFRISEIIKNDCNGNRSELARRINLAPAYVSQLCTGIRAPSDRTILDICREFNVREEWLRNGNGEMKVPKSRGDEIGDIVKSASNQDPEKAMKFFTGLLEEMSDAEIVLMYEIFKRHFNAE